MNATCLLKMSFENFEAAWENAYGTTAREILRYKNKIRKYKIITNGHTETFKK